MTQNMPKNIFLEQSWRTNWVKCSAFWVHFQKSFWTELQDSFKEYINVVPLRLLVLIHSSLIKKGHIISLTQTHYDLLHYLTTYIWNIEISIIYIFDLCLELVSIGSIPLIDLATLHKEPYSWNVKKWKKSICNFVIQSDKIIKRLWVEVEWQNLNRFWFKSSTSTV